MKNIYKSFALLCLGLAATACVDEIFHDERPVYDTTPGNEIVFSATGGIQAGNPKTKTEYGSPFDSNNDNINDAIEIKWLAGDMIDIMSPQSPVKVATYKIDAAEYVKNEKGEETHTHKATTLTRMGDAGLQWSNETQYDFFAIYPSVQHATGGAAFNGSTSLSEAGILTGTLPIEQNYYGDLQNIGTSNMPKWVAKPDMRYAYMVADAEYNKVNESDEAISLQFESLVTALEFEIETGIIGVDGNSITVQQVSLISKSQETDISGTFTYDFNSESNKYQIVDGNGNNRVVMTFPNGVTLKQSGSTLNFTFFLLPVTIPAETLQLQVLFRMGNTQLSRTATIKNAIAPYKKYVYKGVKLEDFNTVPPSSWWDTLDPNVLLTQVSIPVASNVFANSAYGLTGTNNDKYRQQQLSIEALWNLGVRGFEICTQSALQSRTSDATTGNNARFNTMYNDGGTDAGTYFYKQEATTVDEAKSRSLRCCRLVAAETMQTTVNQNFHTVFDNLCSLLKRNVTEDSGSIANSKECLIIICTYMAVSDGYNPYNYVSNLFNYLTWYCEKNERDISMDDFVQINASSTAGDLAGKIAIVIRPGDDERWLPETGEFWNPFSQDYLGSDVAPNQLTATIPDKLDSDWWDHVIYIPDWGSASFDVWDRRYGDEYAREAQYNVEAVNNNRATRKPYIENSLYATTSRHTLPSNGSTNYTASTISGDHQFSAWPSRLETFDFEHKISDDRSAFVQEWMRVIDKNGIPATAITSSGLNLFGDSRRTLWAKWIPSIDEKKEAITDLFNLSVETKGNSTSHDIYINVLTGYYARYSASPQGIYPFMKSYSSAEGSLTISDMGKGGDFQGLANDLNSYTYNLLSAKPGSGGDSLKQEGPWGLVVMDHIGASTDSEKLVNLILQNNFKFILATKPDGTSGDEGGQGGEDTNPEGGSTGTTSVKDYNSVYMDGENAISFE